MKTQKIGILGAGLMGVGICTRFARAGYQVHLYDPSKDALERVPDQIIQILDELAEAERFDRSKATQVLGCIERTNSLETLGNINLAIEAAPERLELKRKLYSSLLSILPADSIIASNTSGFLPDVLNKSFSQQQRARFLIAHFWNPPHWIPLVEIVPGCDTSPESIQSVRQTLTAVGAKPVVLAKAIPGFIGNRLQFALLREVLTIVQTGAASPEVVDEVMKASLGRRYNAIGVLEGADIGGLNTFLDIATHLMPELGVSLDVLDVLREHVDNGKTGLGSGRGFYEWTADRKALIRVKRIRQLRADSDE